ncbi:HIT domain-containing protein [Pseudoalteromonas sp. Of7M-16]|uniref:HIT domain-containing protein n=1 Tax=Pseudoalteromonas sp. Of7M-16 TaxID=2917756 RepID=UPI001EF49FCA|nr:HIT domain-containing protein [Pseudoalteromonas sp. Of7M-16]MCG7548969.1 HIT domain-containing protein [Pseudoalteromonas sp. Of7M-16]
MAFELAPELQRDCIELASWPLCKVLLMNDSQYPWFILVPQVEGAREIIDLTETQQSQFWQESKQLSELLMAVFTPDKLNVAALGNMVPQLHVHHIARYTHDVAWPKPVWGLHPAQPYSDSQLLALKKALSF